MQTTKSFSVQIPSLETKEQSINDLIGHSQHKRGLINALGSTFKFLFGTMDSNDAEYYDQVIDKVEKDEVNIQNLMKDQIQVVKTTIMNFNDTISKLKISEKSLNSNIDKFNKFLQDQYITNDRHELNEEVLEHISTLLYLINELEIKLNEIIDIVLFAKNNVLHPSLLSPKLFLSELDKSTQFLTNGKKFPTELTYSNLNTLLSISRIKSVYKNNRLIFVISVPITDEPNYKIYHLIPLPIPHKDKLSYAYIEPKFKYLMVSFNKVNYVQLSDLNSCILINETEYLCESHIIYTTLNKPICETALLVNANLRIPDDCNTRILTGNIEIWQNLLSNEWIYVVSENQVLTISCNDFLVDEQISNTGIIKLKQGCKAYSAKTQLIAQNKLIINFQHAIPEIDITEDDCCEKTKTNKTDFNYYLNHVKLSNIKLDDLNIASHKLDSLNDEINRIQNEPHIVKYSNYYKYIIFIICTIIVIILATRFYKCVRPFLPRSLQIDRHCCCKSVVVNQYNSVPSRELSSIELDTIHTTNLTLPSEQELSVVSRPKRTFSKLRSKHGSIAGRLSHDE